MPPPVAALVDGGRHSHRRVLGILHVLMYLLILFRTKPNYRMYMGLFGTA
jgi:hypothetical protein